MLYIGFLRVQFSAIGVPVDASAPTATPMAWNSRAFMLETIPENGEELAGVAPSPSHQQPVSSMDVTIRNSHTRLTDVMHRQ